MFPKLESRADILKMLDEMIPSRKDILGQCQALSEPQLHDPVYEGTWSVLKNLQHLAWAEEFMLAWILKRPDPLPKSEIPKEPDPDFEKVVRALDEAHAAVIAFVKSHPEEVLKEKCEYVPHRGLQTVGGLLYHIVEHEIGHRTFVLHKLRKLKAK